MQTKVTQGIKISVQAKFQAEYSKPVLNQFVFSYHITIENQSQQTVQLLERYWLITDSLGKIREVKGKGVIGLQPVLEPGDVHTYDSWCPLVTPMGHMEGYYMMLDGLTNEHFKALVPRFQLIASTTLN